MDKLVLGDLTIRVEEGEGGVFRLHWEGASNGRDPGQALRAFFAIVLSRASEKKAQVEQHFEKLRFLNSATLAFLVQLIPDAESRGLSMSFSYDASLRWQSLSFQGFKPFTGPTKRFTIVPLGAGRPAAETGG